MQLVTTLKWGQWIFLLVCKAFGEFWVNMTFADCIVWSQWKILLHWKYHRRAEYPGMSVGESMHKEEPQMTVQPPAAPYQARSETAESCHLSQTTSWFADVQLDSAIYILLTQQWLPACNHVSTDSRTFYFLSFLEINWVQYRWDITPVHFSPLEIQEGG